MKPCERLPQWETSVNIHLEYVPFVFCLEGNWITTEK